MPAAVPKQSASVHVHSRSESELTFVRPCAATTHPAAAPRAVRFETLSGRPARRTAMTADEGRGDAADVDAATVRHVATLARVDLDEEEVERFTGQFAEILEYFEALDDVPDVDSEADLVNVMRPDEVREGLTQGEALRNAPETEDGRFKGPRVS